MRKRLIIAVPVLAALALSATWLSLRKPTDPVAAARQAMAHQDMRQAALYLRQAIRAKPHDADAAFLLGKADLALGNPAAAQTELLHARAYGYDDAAIVLPLGQTYLQQHHFAELVQDFPVEAAPQTVRAATLSLRATAQMGLNDLADATSSIAAAEVLAPSDPAVLLAAARLALLRGDNAAAAANLTRVLSGASLPDETTREDTLLLQGDLALRNADPGAALAKARDAIAENPTRLDARLLEARALAATGQFHAARASIDAILHRAPKHVAANYLRVILALRAADYGTADAALQLIGTAIDSLPRGLYFTAVTKLGLGQFVQAEDAATQFLAQHPDDASGLKLMAAIDLARNHPDRTLAILRSSALGNHPDADTLDLRGRALALSGDLRGARESLAKASALHPDDPVILNRLAAVEINLGNLDAGEADLKQSLALAPRQSRASGAIVDADIARGDLAAARADLGQMRRALGDTEAAGILAAQIKLAALDLDGADNELRAVLQHFPDSRAAILAQSRIAALRGDTKAAQVLLVAALKRHPADAAILGAVLPALYAEGDTEQAITLAQAAHDAAPADATLTAILADTFVHARQPERAVGLLDRASAGTNPDLDELRARIQAQQGQTDSAITTLVAILDKSPADTAARIDLAALQAKAGQIEAARATLHEGLAHDPGNAALLNASVGLELRQSGLKAALASAAALCANSANLPAAAELRGKLYLAAGNPRAAANAFRAAYATAPTSTLAIDAANAEDHAGSPATGISLLESWTALHPQDLAAQFALSSLYLEAGNETAAAARLQTVLASDSRNAAALNNLAWIRQHQGDTIAARSLAERAYFMAPNAEIADTLGWILVRQGESATSLPLLKQAAATADPQLHAAASYHYAVALAASGHREVARAILQAALAADAKFHDRDEAVRFLGTLE